MKYNIKLETQEMIGGGEENRLARESAIMALISRLNANPNTWLSAEQAGEMLRNAEARYQQSLEK